MRNRIAGLIAGVALAGAASAQDIGPGMSDTSRWVVDSYSEILVPSMDPAACLKACRGDLRCYAWNFRRDPSSPRTTCELKPRPGPLVYDPDYISGQVYRSQPAPDPDEDVVPQTPPVGGAPPPYQPPADSDGDLWSRFAMLEGTETSGAAYASWSYKGKGDGGVTRCAKACAGDSKCAAFVVRSDRDVAPPPQVICELKRAAGTALPNPMSTSGIKR